MQLVRPFLLTLLFLCQNAAITAAAEVNGEGRLITHREASDVVHHYRSIPGAGVVKGEGRLITHGEAADVVKRYRSIPGGGVVKGEGRLITHGEAADVVKRYRSIPGDGVVKGEGRLITHGEAADVVKRYRSIPGDGVVKGEGRLITHGEAADVVKRYRSVPGGLILEGNALGLEWVKTARYEPTLNAFVLNGLVVYQSPISSHGAAILARAIAEDDRIGVSLTEESQIVYGRLPNSSDVATDLKLADGFLGDLILPPRDWTVGYRLAEGFVPRDDVGQANATVLFRFRDFQFATKANKLELEGAHFDARSRGRFGKAGRRRRLPAGLEGDFGRRCIGCIRSQCEARWREHQLLPAGANCCSCPRLWRGGCILSWFEGNRRRSAGSHAWHRSGKRQGHRAVADAREIGA